VRNCYKWSFRHNGGREEEESPRPIGTVNRKMDLFRATIVFHHRRKTLKMEAACSSEILMSTYKTIWYHHPDDCNPNYHWQETSTPIAKPI
jgi:hypothetical protein